MNLPYSHLRLALAGAILVSALPRLLAADESPILCPAPPLGWNSFDSYGVYLHEEAAMANLEAMAEKLAGSGYRYFVIDGGWYGEYELRPGTRYPAEKHASDLRLDDYGRVQPSRCYFPGGLKPIIDRCHELGLKFGLHMMRGIPRKAVDLNLPILGTSYRAVDIADPGRTCSWCPYNYGVDMSRPGAQAYYDSLFAQFAEWGVDFVKYDDIVPFPEEVRAVARARENCGRDMVLSLSPGNGCDVAAIETYRMADMLRVTPDIWDDQKGIDLCFAAWRKWSGQERAGFWIDMDMIPFGQLQLMNPPPAAAAEAGQSVEDVRLSGKGHRRHSGLTRPQMHTFITMRALAASPLMMGGNLPDLDEFSLRLITNPEILACNQNGIMGGLTWEHGVEIWRAPNRALQGCGWAGVFNRTAGEVELQVLPEHLGLPPGSQLRLVDVWNESSAEIGANAPWARKVAPQGALFFRYETVTVGRNRLADD